MGKKRKLEKQMHKRGLDDEPALVVCVGKSCCRREESRATLEAAERRVAELELHVRVVATDCLHVCKKGPIAATYPKIRIKKHVTAKRAQKMLDKLGR